VSRQVQGIPAFLRIAERSGDQEAGTALLMFGSRDVTIELLAGAVS
jgi:hypothetical protein